MGATDAFVAASHLVAMISHPDDARYAAVFLDFENVYYHLKNSLGSAEDPSDAVIQMVSDLKKRMSEQRGEQTIILHAYADFERIESNAQGALYLAGVESHNVLSTDHKNAADMRLCIDALDTLYTRPEIRTFVFVAGDRDYIPVIQHLKKHARTVLAVAFQSNMSGDLLINVGKEFFIDAQELLSEDMIEKLAAAERNRLEEERRAVRPVAARTVGFVPEPVERYDPVRFEPIDKLEDDDEREALKILLEKFGRHNEVWITPFLHELRKQMPLLAEYERKSLISNLATHGVISVEKRRGEPNDYSVILINWDHPDVRDLNPG